MAKKSPRDAAMQKLKQDLRAVVDRSDAMDPKKFGERESYEIVTEAIECLNSGYEMRLEEINQEDEDMAEAVDDE